MCFHADVHHYLFITLIRCFPALICSCTAQPQTQSLQILINFPCYQKLLMHSYLSETENLRFINHRNSTSSRSFETHESFTKRLY